MFQVMVYRNITIVFVSPMRILLAAAGVATPHFCLNRTFLPNSLLISALLVPNYFHHLRS